LENKFPSNFNHISRNSQVKIKKILVETLIFFIKLLIFFKRLVAAFFVAIIYKPGRKILSFIFHKIVVKAYCYYRSLIKRLGWGGFKGNIFSFLLNQKLVHVLVGLLTVVIILTNLTAKTKAGVISEQGHNTIIASLVTSEFGSLENDELIEEVALEEETILPTQKNYLDSLAVIKSQPQAVMQTPDEIDEIEEVAAMTQDSSAIVKPDLAATKKIKRPRTEIIYYTVKPGDSVSTIAAEYEISVNTILWENNLSAWSLIRPGQKLAILPTTGVTHEVVRGENLSMISKKYSVDETKIREANNLGEDAKLAIGQKLLVPGGRQTRYVAESSGSYIGLTVLKDLVKPSGAAPVASNMMNWPTQGHRITQYYSWRHLAIDIANKAGTPIYAADAGTVESIGWETGYGNTIIINHGGSKKTRYAHLSKFYVKKGQKVDKGETIAAMGSTGWSTGPHLHFEVIISGRKYNPLNYIR